MLKENWLIGFIGQGFIGKSYADDFENRGYKIVRYSVKQFPENKEKIKDCDAVFIAVPAQTLPTGFDDNVIVEVLKLVGKGKIAVIKCTLPQGYTEKFQAMYPDIFVVHSPEFLTEKNAAWEAAHPERNIIGYTEKSFPCCEDLMEILPPAEFKTIVPARTAELIKYAGNCLLYFKVMMMNIIYDISQKNGIDYDQLKAAVGADSRLGHSHLDIVHFGGRGAGGHCFIKDFAALREMYVKQFETERNNKDPHYIAGLNLLRATEEFNKSLLLETGKDKDLLQGVYGDDYDKVKI